MAKRMDVLLFPGGKKKALTLSYDDGVIQDRRLIGILDQYGLKATFNLNAGVLGFTGRAMIDGRDTDISKVPSSEVSVLYTAHEVAGHGLWHSSLPDVGVPAAMLEVIEDRRELEELSGKLVQSFAYPFGRQNKTIQDILRLSGYQSARTVNSTHRFDIPDNFLQWDPTCHHNDPELMTLAKRFCSVEDPFKQAPLFCLWGHAYEFDTHDNWNIMTDFAQYVSGFRDQVWFVANGECVQYVLAWRSLQYSADASMIHNPSATAVWLGQWGKKIIIPAGATVTLPDEGR